MSHPWKKMYGPMMNMMMNEYDEDREGWKMERYRCWPEFEGTADLMSGSHDQHGGS